MYLPTGRSRLACFQHKVEAVEQWKLLQKQHTICALFVGGGVFTDLVKEGQVVFHPTSEPFEQKLLKSSCFFYHGKSDEKTIFTLELSVNLLQLLVHEFMNIFVQKSAFMRSPLLRTILCVKKESTAFFMGNHKSLSAFLSSKKKLPRRENVSLKRFPPLPIWRHQKKGTVMSQ